MTNITVSPEMMFRAMGDVTRLKMLTVLAQHELGVSELVEVLDQPQSTISRHLKVLKDTGLVWVRRIGASTLYGMVDTTTAPSGNNLTVNLLSWARSQPVSSVIDRRLQTVLCRRRDRHGAFFSQLGRRWDTLREESFGAAFHLEAFISLLPNEWTVADIGTGTGYLLGPLATHFKHVIGVDPVDEMLQVASERVSTASLKNVELRKGDLANLPLEDNSLDLAIALLVLHHVPSPQTALAEIRRAVKPGGHLLIVEQAPHENQTFFNRMHDRWWGFEPSELSEWLNGHAFKCKQAAALATLERASDAPKLFAIAAQLQNEVY